MPLIPHLIAKRYQRLRPVLLEKWHEWNTFHGRSTGVHHASRDPQLIVSLTTVPGRLHRAHLAISSLLGQSVKPDRVVLWLGDRGNGAVPEVPETLRKLESRGLEIHVRRDVGPHTKLIHALTEFSDAIIVTADDDRYYPRKWLSGLYRAYQLDPAYVYCYRAHAMTFDGAGRLNSYMDWGFLARGSAGPSPLLFPTGTGGVLYPPGSLSDEVFNVDAFQELCPRADDVWFKAMALLRGVMSQKVRADFREFETVRDTQHTRLWAENQGENDRQIAAVFDRYELYPMLRERP